ncbi:MAG: ATP-binding protein, partial [Deltaproteobacteria bacterium]|nr:ATP-binding protein [Deltaproteobacteria bacterium]
LLHFGLVRVLAAPPDMYLFAPITVDPVLIARLKGHPFAGYEVGTVTEIHRADRAIDELAIEPKLVRDIVVDLAEPPLDGRPVRVVVRGRPGSGRTTLLTALADRVGRAVALIDCERLPRDGRALAQRLRLELRRARLRGALPCVSGLEISESPESEGVEHIREVFRSHPGPVMVRTTPEYRPPLEPGFLDYQISPLSEGKRMDFWAGATERAGLPVADAPLLASRFRVGPGTIERVVHSVKMRVDAGAIPASDDYTNELDQAARQHIDTRLSSVASRVTRLARWEQVALPDDLLDSIREFVGRVHHRRTVYESWGFDRKMSTSRGLTALFYGAPGTGKTMVSGLIARELNLDLYRVDLARITSKWVGETEKNLAQVFDAAEDGQAVIVFDEADSLFAKRTEVKSSVDKYANLEVNYLLQRLDSFEGIAILTTNLEGSIDTAFKRRLSLRLAFPFPDEEMRVRLWAAHIPPEMPTAGDFDFDDLAKRFPMSGGYIRNSTIRAAFLAAQENLPLSQDHLLRAIQLEYQEMGKLSASGRIE